MQAIANMFITLVNWFTSWFEKKLSLSELKELYKNDNAILSSLEKIEKLEKILELEKIKFGKFVKNSKIDITKPDPNYDNENGRIFYEWKHYENVNPNLLESNSGRGVVGYCSELEIGRLLKNGTYLIYYDGQLKATFLYNNKFYTRVFKITDYYVKWTPYYQMDNDELKQRGASLHERFMVKAPDGTKYGEYTSISDFYREMDFSKMFGGNARNLRFYRLSFGKYDTRNIVVEEEYEEIMEMLNNINFRLGAEQFEKLQRKIQPLEYELAESIENIATALRKMQWCTDVTENSTYYEISFDEWDKNKLGQLIDEFENVKIEFYKQWNKWDKNPEVTIEKMKKINVRVKNELECYSTVQPESESKIEPEIEPEIEMVVEKIPCGQFTPFL
jgi:hypothetical protein